MNEAITLEDMQRIFSVTDRLGLHRERVKVPLARRGSGSVERIAGGTVRITVPADTPIEVWLETLERELASLL
jgi:hypothetical protein